MPRLTQVRALWSRLTGTLWFLPGAIVISMSILAVAMVELSSRVDAEALARFPRVFGASADSSRALLSAIAGAMITVAGLTFSLTMVAVTQASAQYTPRILRNFMRDRGNQLVLGVYVGIFAYSLLVVRTIRSGDEGRFVPSLAVVLGIALAMGSVGVLIFFVHHIASALQASTIVQRVTRETLGAVDRLFPDDLDDESARAAPGTDEVLATPARRGRWVAVPASRTGYVQAVDDAALLDVVERLGIVVRLVPSVGDFVVEGVPIAWVARRPARRAAQAPDDPHGPRADTGPPAVADDDADDSGDDDARDEAEDPRGALAPLFAVSGFRTVEQDVAFGVRQLVDIALKALSPGINDTTTAVTCVDYLGAILVRLAPRRVEARLRARDGTVCVVAPGPTFESLLALAVDEIRQHAGSNVGVLARLVATLELVASCAPPGPRRRLVEAHLELVAESAEANVPSAHDRDSLRERVGRARSAARAVTPSAAMMARPGGPAAALTASRDAAARARAR